MTTHGLRRPLLLIFLLPLFAQADSPSPPSPAATPAPATVMPGDTVRVDATATGSSRDEAIAGALTQAVHRVQGKELPLPLLQDMFLNAMREERRVRMSMVADTRIRATRISTAVAFVQDYQVTATARDEDNGRWTASVRADVVSPEARLARQRETVTLAVLPFVFMQEEESEVGGAAAQAANKKTQADIRAFRQTVAALLERQPRLRLNALSAEQDSTLETAADTPGKVDWATLARNSGASSFVTVQVEDFRIEPVKLKGNITTSRLDGGFTLHYRLIRYEDGRPEVVKSGTFTADTRNPWLRPLAMTTSNAPAAPELVQRRIAAVQARVAELFASTLMADLVLPQVVAREGDRLLLQRGASQLRPGDQIAVLGPSVSTVDESLGLTLREDGLRIAVLEVMDAKPERIEARVLKGNAFAVQPGSLLRRIGAGSTGLAAAAIPLESAGDATPPRKPSTQ